MDERKQKSNFESEGPLLFGISSGRDFLLKFLTPVLVFSGVLIAGLKFTPRNNKPDVLAYQILKDKNGQPDSICITGAHPYNYKTDNDGMVSEFSGPLPIRYDDKTLSYPLDKKAIEKYRQIITVANKIDTNGKDETIYSKSGALGTNESTIKKITNRDKYLQKELFKFARSQVPDSVKKSTAGILLNR